MNSLTNTLVGIIGSPLVDNERRSPVVVSQQLFDYAFRNNVEMLYCGRLEEEGLIGEIQQAADEVKGRQQQTLASICRFSEVLRAGNIPHAVTKTLRLYPGTPNDIDTLFLGDLSDYEKAAQYLTTQGYRITAPNDMQYEFFDTTAEDGFNPDKSGGRFYIDFYRELAADHMPYMDSNFLRAEVIETDIPGCNTPVNIFTPRAEMTILSLHSVLMHRTIPLEVIYTYSYYLARMSEAEIKDFWQFVCASHAEPAMRSVLAVMEQIYRDVFDFVPAPLDYLLRLSGISKREKREFINENSHMPHTVTLMNFVISVFAKLRGKRARRGFFKELAHMLNPVFAVEVLYHMLSKKRIRKHSKHV